MALKPTIYKARIALSDLNRDYYDTLNLTIAQHPSETLERMMVRVLAYCLNAREALSFCKGLSAPDEPDLWARTLDGRIALWIDVGEPAADRVRKAMHQAEQVRIYSFNSKSEVWWRQGANRFRALGAEFYRFDWRQAQDLAGLARRTMDLSVTISAESVYVSSDQASCEASLVTLR